MPPDLCTRFECISINASSIPVHAAHHRILKQEWLDCEELEFMRWRDSIQCSGLSGTFTDFGLGPERSNICFIVETTIEK